MSGAILQGVPATTLDTDIWIDLPSREYIHLLNLCRRLGASIRANTVVDLIDGSTVNFLYEVHGLRNFRYEYQRARRLKWLGTEVAVLPLERIYASKKFVGRPTAAAGANDEIAAPHYSTSESSKPHRAMSDYSDRLGLMRLSYPRDALAVAKMFETRNSDPQATPQ